MAEVCGWWIFCSHNMARTVSSIGNNLHTTLSVELKSRDRGAVHLTLLRSQADFRPSDASTTNWSRRSREWADLLVPGFQINQINPSCGCWFHQFVDDEVPQWFTSCRRSIYGLLVPAQIETPVQRSGYLIR